MKASLLKFYHHYQRSLQLSVGLHVGLLVIMSVNFNSTEPVLATTSFIEEAVHATTVDAAMVDQLVTELATKEQQEMNAANKKLQQVKQQQQAIESKINKLRKEQQQLTTGNSNLQEKYAKAKQQIEQQAAKAKELAEQQAAALKKKT